LSSCNAANRLDDAGRGQSCLLAHHFRLILIDEAIGHHLRAPLEAVIQQAVVGQILQHMAAEAADRTFLDGDENLVILRQLPDEIGIERLHETGVRHRRRKTECRELIGGFQRLAEPRAERQQRNRRTLAQNAALADRESLTNFRHLNAGAFPARIPERRRTIVDRSRGRDHVLELGLVCRCHDDEVRQAPEISKIERTCVGCTISPDEPSAIDRKTNRQALDRDVMHDLIVPALQERRIDRGERLHAFRREACRERHGMLLGDTDVERAFRKLAAENIEPCAIGHRRRDRDDLRIFFGFGNQAVSKHARIRRRRRLRLRLHARDDVEFCNAMILVGRSFRRRVSLALLRHDMNEDRTLLGIAHVLQHGHQLPEVVPIDRPDIMESEFFEPRPAALPQTARVFFDSRRTPLPALRQPLRKLLGEIVNREIGRTRRRACETR